MACYCGASPHLLPVVCFLGHHLALLIAKNYADCAKRRLCRHIRVTGRAAYFPKVLTSTEDIHRKNVIIFENLQASHQASMYGRFLRVEGSYELEAEFAIGARQTLPLLKPNPCRNLGRCPEETRQ